MYSVFGFLFFFISFGGEKVEERGNVRVPGMHVS